MPQRILLIQLRQLGDILLTTPCIREIKRQHPDAHITFLSHPMGRLILNGCPDLDELLTYSTDSLVSEWQLARSIKQRKFDLVFDFMNNPRSAFYAAASMSPQRIAFHSRRRIFYTKTVQKPLTARYIVQEKFDLLRAVGLDPQDESLVLPWTESDAGPALKFFSSQGTQRRLRFILSPTHRRPDRQWPLERYAKLAEFLVRGWDAEVTWLWGPGEEDIAEEGVKLCEVPTRKAPKTTFREMAALIANHDCFIGNSNGPSHVAVAADTPSLQIHGPTNAISWCPMTERHQALSSPRRKSAPSEAINDISVDQVIEKLVAMKKLIINLAQNPKAPHA